MMAARVDRMGDHVNDFHQALELWGPGRLSAAALQPDDASRYCRQLARAHYENFPVATLLLPRHLRQHFYNIYAYCRWADDLADETGDPQRAAELLAWWRSGLDDCFAGEARHPVFVALASTINQFNIPRQPFADLIAAFEQDQCVTEYHTFDALLDYCGRSANPVGRLVLCLLRQDRPEYLVWSDKICTGLQLANFWQDVARDYDIGRVYLPVEDRVHFGYSDSDLAERVTNPAFLNLMEFQVGRARAHLRSGLPLADHLPGRFQVDIELFARGGLKILDRIEQSGFRVWQNRPRIGKRDVCGMFCRAVLRTLGRRLRLLQPHQWDPAAEAVP